MAKVQSSFKCLICQEPLRFPADISIVDFTILFLQFYRDHDRCERLAEELKKPKEVEATDADRPA